MKNNKTAGVNGIGIKAVKEKLLNIITQLLCNTLK